MNRLLRVMLLLKVVVMLSLGSSMAWAECDEHEQHASSGQMGQGEWLLAAADSSSDSDEPDDGEAPPDDDDGAPPDEEEEGDSQT